LAFARGSGRNARFPLLPFFCCGKSLCYKLFVFLKNPFPPSDLLFPPPSRRLVLLPSCFFTRPPTTPFFFYLPASTPPHPASLARPRFGPAWHPAIPTSFFCFGPRICAIAMNPSDFGPFFQCFSWLGFDWSTVSFCFLICFDLANPAELFPACPTPRDVIEGSNGVCFFLFTPNIFFSFWTIPPCRESFFSPHSSFISMESRFEFFLFQATHSLHTIVFFLNEVMRIPFPLCSPGNEFGVGGGYLPQFFAITFSFLASGPRLRVPQPLFVFFSVGRLCPFLSL